MKTDKSMDSLVFEHVITSKNKWFNINFREIWEYRDLVSMFVKRNFVAQYKQTILGPAWAIVQPLLTTIVFTVVFGKMANLPTDEVPPFLFYMCANINWAFFAGCMVGTANTFVGNVGIFGKVYFPRLTMPIAIVLTQSISFGIQFILFLLIWGYYYIVSGKICFSISFFYYPFVILQMGMLGLGCGIIVASITTKYRDLMNLVGFGTQLWMYGSAIVYPVSMVPEQYRDWFLLNPMAIIIEASRNAFFGQGMLSFENYLVSWIITLLILMIGIVLFSKVEKNFMDTI